MRKIQPFRARKIYDPENSKKTSNQRYQNYRGFVLINIEVKMKSLFTEVQKSPQENTDRSAGFKRKNKNIIGGKMTQK